MQLLIGAALAGIAFTLNTSPTIQATLAFFWLIAFSSATHDIAADGFYMLGLDTHDQALFVGIRSTFYRIATIFGQGLLIAVAGFLELYTRKVAYAWSLTFYAVAGLFIALFLTMICCIILGMGVPTTANYIIMASTCAPILINGMSMHILAANMFVFYFGIVADITPPVALAAYAGAAIAKAPPMKTALNATRLAIAAFIIPYIFAYNNAMIFVGDVTFFGVASIVISATLGMASIASGFMGYLIHDLKWYSRIALIAGGLLMVIPGTVTDLAGLAILIVILLIQRAENKKEKKAAV